MKYFINKLNIVKNVCVANDINMKTMSLLTDDMIKELIPIIGHRARFNTNLNQWRTIISGLQNTTTIVIFLFQYFYSHLKHILFRCGL